MCKQEFLFLHACKCDELHSICSRYARCVCVLFHCSAIDLHKDFPICTIVYYPFGIIELRNEFYGKHYSYNLLELLSVCLSPFALPLCIIVSFPPPFTRTQSSIHYLYDKCDKLISIYAISFWTMFLPCGFFRIKAMNEQRGFYGGMFNSVNHNAIAEQ